MQPNNNQPENWQQPTAQNSGQVYSAPANGQSQNYPTQPIQPPVQSPVEQPIAPISQPQPQPTPVVAPVQQPEVTEVPAAVVTANPGIPVNTMTGPSDVVTQSQVPNVVQPGEASASNLDVEPVRWTAPEYLSHPKGKIWYVVFGVVVFALMVLAIYMQAWTFAVLIPIMATALLVYVRRTPQNIQYALSGKGLYIGDKLYPYKEFKGFGVIHQPGEFSVTLIPTKRFAPGVSVFFPEESGEAIVDMLGTRMPMQDMKMDAIDRLLRKLRI